MTGDGDGEVEEAHHSSMSKPKAETERHYYERAAAR